MKTIADYEFNNVTLSSGILLISRAIRSDFPQRSVEIQLQSLIDEARREISPQMNKEEQLEKLLALFYQSWKFGGASGVYCLSDTLWLDKVLHSRQGSPVILGVILIHIAQALELSLMPVVFPTQLILRIDCPDKPVRFINPTNGETLSEYMLDVWLKGNISQTAKLAADDLQEADNISIVLKVLETIKVALMEEKQLELALKASEAVLMFDPDDPYEIRDRGLIYAELDCNHIAVSDLNYFVEHCPEDPIAEMIRMQIYSIEQQCIVLH
ncbi:MULTISPECIES: invasion regulator SirB1 [Photorhabdus]|uniref:Transcriptional regulator sirb1 n=2 Tax=Photorhabdus asymbiotica TaxID=291112 RepID=C7BN16_PHOAA|nr:invasion regulator SirB1 [Photorhabdus asymbiotica]RKS57030.1 transcriptional regulator [Photorhabdus asymbiotica]CAQ84615.1 putative transcriptional regulator sirb1 [Photorhabdus asymbiotica]